MGKRETKRRSMEAIVRAYQSSSLKRKEFAAKAGVHIDKLSYWIRKGAKKEEGKFIPIAIPSNKIESIQVEICYPNGIIIKAVTSSASFINQLIKTY